MNGILNVTVKGVPIAVSVNEMSKCATKNCEDTSGDDGWAYCGGADCSSCGGGCGDGDCRKCNPDEKGGSKEASFDRAFDTGWSIVKAGDFNPDDDTCEACGGQKTPEHPYYGPDGPENGNCAKELPDCR
tara:strand:+ start:211 stop:600 length:390 start_codon:yes stop_codon:yes gene_type:complete